MGAVRTEPALERESICFPHHGTQGVLQHGDRGFKDEIDRIYAIEENNALEQLINLKTELRMLPGDEFFSAVTEGMSRILGAEICFVMKRVLVDDQESAVEMPPHGAPGSCVMAAALHYCASDGTKNTFKATKYHAFGCPCAYMRHDKVFLIPHGLSEFITNNPNTVPMPCDAYIAVPLFAEGKCFAHFGAMWSVEAAAQRKLSWAFIEMFLHSLEDLISQKFLEGSNFLRQQSIPAVPNRVISHDAITVAQSLRPYAGSLSHELRTPMQGVVGLLDVMYATVQEALDQADPRLREIFETLKDSIETVQDSSRRAVEAADNVVHAYDMDMSVPDAPAELLDDIRDQQTPSSATADRRPEILVAGSNLPLMRPNKRRRDEWYASAGSPPKAARLDQTSPCRCSQASQSVQGDFEGAEGTQARLRDATTTASTATVEDLRATANIPFPPNRIIAPGLRHTSLRELLQYVINDGLKVGGRPDSVVGQETDNGEIIEVRNRGSDGTAGTKIIEWSIDPYVPHTLFIDEKDLSKLISCVFLNAIKFTGTTGGRVRISVKMSNRSRYITIRVADNGPGIPAAFLPRLFKPFQQENGSLTRSSEGLGLGLMVAKGIARKLGGDLVCTRAETEELNHGTEFEIKVPLQAGDTISRPNSPFGSPLPRRAIPAHATSNSSSTHLPPAHAAPANSHHRPHALGEATLAHLVPTTPPSSNGIHLDIPAYSGDEISPRTLISSPPLQSLHQPVPRPRIRKSVAAPAIDRDLAKKYPLTFLVAEDNKINRKLLVSMLSKFGYKTIYEAHDGTEAVRQMTLPHDHKIDVVLMDLWMPLMDGYEATERILGMDYRVDGEDLPGAACPTVLAVTADVTHGALERAASVGMKGFMTKPYKLMDLQSLIERYCASYRTGGG